MFNEEKHLKDIQAKLDKLRDMIRDPKTQSPKLFSTETDFIENFGCIMQQISLIKSDVATLQHRLD